MGWCHNRVRVVASHFLVKHLLLPWQWGLKHLWDCQIDADLECDALGWQYVSGCLSGGFVATVAPQLPQLFSTVLARPPPHLACTPPQPAHRAPHPFSRTMCLHAGLFACVAHTFWNMTIYSLQLRTSPTTCRTCLLTCFVAAYANPKDNLSYLRPRMLVLLVSMLQMRTLSTTWWTLRRSGSASTQMATT